MDKTWAKQLIQGLATKFIHDAVNQIPSLVSINFDPFKNFILRHGNAPKFSAKDVVDVKGVSYRKQVIVFKDEEYNKPQY